ncbi:MAG: biotin-dependent carboxyltransferase family protein [Oscillospiraceae bacterium]|nr:biotin-dependent carboxyltransferase family protein [Clostridiaceae bacterium]MDY5947798.1 biotin-dependent carboxyltransferase family protein [Oscillospiraceae bacterium]
MKLEIISPGLLSTIQDLGRFGYMDSGFSPSGAMDAFSARLANILVGNSQGEGVIEMTAVGITARFCCSSVIAVTGADMSPEINGKKIEMYKSIPVSAGDVLSMKNASNGMRAYLAVACGFDIEPVMGSLSTNLKCAVGGFRGRKLKAGDLIPLRRCCEITYIGERHFKPRNVFSNTVTVRAVPGPQDDYFSISELEKFFSSKYKASAESDRMGIRLDGESVCSIDGVDIISDGIVTGSVQIPPSGKPIVMMADRQTTGGYAKIATVINADLKYLAQLRAGDTVRFEKISQAQAEKINKSEQKFFKRLERGFLFAD